MNTSDQPGVLAQLMSCAERFDSSAGLRTETLAHLVNGGVHLVSVESLHAILQNNSYPVAAVTHIILDTTRHDTTVSIFLSFPRKDWFAHELANALVARHRAGLLGLAPNAQTSPFYQRCVSWCPQCTGAY
jgi:hypothetical protein